MSSHELLFVKARISGSYIYFCSFCIVYVFWYGDWAPEIPVNIWSLTFEESLIHISLYTLVRPRRIILSTILYGNIDRISWVWRSKPTHALIYGIYTYHREIKWMSGRREPPRVRVCVNVPTHMHTHARTKWTVR